MKLLKKQGDKRCVWWYYNTDVFFDFNGELIWNM